MVRDIASTVRSSGSAKVSASPRMPSSTSRILISAFDSSTRRCSQRRPGFLQRWRAGWRQAFLNGAKRRRKNGRIVRNCAATNEGRIEHCEENIAAGLIDLLEVITGAQGQTISLNSARRIFLPSILWLSNSPCHRVRMAGPSAAKERGRRRLRQLLQRGAYVMKGARRFL
jgi:hypothetical protein